jgi:predicted DNA-binding WGR domain protein
MQLPPTNFFSATRSDDELLIDDESAGAVVQDLDADSFLTQSARNLASTMLGWHYRSRSESLISFSNHAFYDARLLTIPDRQLPAAARGEIVVKAAAEGAANVDALLARSVSFHFHPEAVYERRSNAAEADYIAHVLREMLSRETKLSIGVVAFSEAQQSEIESALNRLGAEDATFRNRLEAEYEREDNGEFCGLFVKNLENVQGDERDVILLSVCYGYDRGRRMLMNFGPINQRGGEKRLNVIFSRARKHMAVVSSIRHADITNDYNDGANCLRSFLEYAAACSIGDAATARRVLQTSAGLLGVRGVSANGEAKDNVAVQLAAALRKRGLIVETDVGQSSFRLPLAVRRENDDARTLGVMIDDATHYAQQDLLERFLLRPGVLQAFGWRVIAVFAKDWFHEPEAVCRRVEEALADVAAKPVPEPELPEETSRDVKVEPVSATAKPVIERVVKRAEDDGAASRTASEGRTKEAAAVPVVEAPRRFTCEEGGARKFWEVALRGAELTVRFGRIGTKGQEQTKAFPNVEAARREQEKLIRSKLAKGYEPIADSR